MVTAAVEYETEMLVAQPHPSLRRLVRGYTGYRITSLPGTHLGLPSRHLTLVVTVEGTVDVSRAGQRPVSLPALAAGLHDRPVVISHDGHQHGVQADLTPLGARALLGLPAGALAGVSADLGTLLGPAAGELLDRLRSAATWRDRFDQLDAVLTRVARPGGGPGPELGWAWQRLASSAGAVEVGALAAEIGWSRQHLRDRFLREFGLTPKVAARVMRFEAARALLTRPDRPALASVAAACGYYDQAHLSRDWREFAGVTLSRWLAEELPFVQDGAPSLPSS